VDNADALFEARLLTHRLVSPSPTSQPEASGVHDGQLTPTGSAAQGQGDSASGPGLWDAAERPAPLLPLVLLLLLLLLLLLHAAEWASSAGLVAHETA
jgi:hypothetical protein